MVKYHTVGRISTCARDPALLYIHHKTLFVEFSKLSGDGWTETQIGGPADKRTDKWVPDVRTDNFRTYTWVDTRTDRQKYGRTYR